MRAHTMNEMNDLSLNRSLLLAVVAAAIAAGVQQRPAGRVAAGADAGARRARRRRERSGARRRRAGRDGHRRVAGRRADRPRHPRLGVRALHRGRRQLRRPAAAGGWRDGDAGRRALHGAGRGRARGRAAARSCSARSAPTGRWSSIRPRAYRSAPASIRPGHSRASSSRSRPTAPRPTATRTSPTTASSSTAPPGTPPPRPPPRRASPATRAPACPVVTATAPGAGEVKQPIRLVSDGDDRETFTPAGAPAATLEELQLSNFATAGKFDSSYAAIFATDTRPDADVTMKWAPPKAADVPAGRRGRAAHLRRPRSARRPRLDQPRALRRRAVASPQRRLPTVSPAVAVVALLPDHGHGLSASGPRADSCPSVTRTAVCPLPVSGRPVAEIIGISGWHGPC